MNNPIRLNKKPTLRAHFNNLTVLRKIYILQIIMGKNYLNSFKLYKFETIKNPILALQISFRSPNKFV